jgi:hypothetical protein
MVKIITLSGDDVPGLDGDEGEEPPDSISGLGCRARAALSEAGMLDLLAIPLNIYRATSFVAETLFGQSGSSSLLGADSETLCLSVQAGVARLRLAGADQGCSTLAMSADLRRRLEAGTLTISQVLDEAPSLILGACPR